MIQKENAISRYVRQGVRQEQGICKAETHLGGVSLVHHSLSSLCDMYMIHIQGDKRSNSAFGYFGENLVDIDSSWTCTHVN